MSFFYQHEGEHARSTKYALNTTWPVCSLDKRAMHDQRDYLRGRRLDPDLAGANGWYPSYHAGDSNLRIVIPAISPVKSHVYWQSRAVNPLVTRRYLSPTGSRFGALVKVIPVVKKTKGIVIVEGPTDSLAVAGAGYHSIAVLGIMPDTATLDHLKNLIAPQLPCPVIIVFDTEEVATSQSILLTHWLCSYGIKARSFVCADYGKDLASLLPAQRAKTLASFFELT